MPESTEEPAILFARLLDGKGGATVLEGDAVSQMIRDDALAWVHLNRLHPDTRRWLRDEVGYLDDLILDALLAEETRPRMVEFEEGVLLILRGVNLNENAEPEDMVSVRMWIDPHRIITMRRHKLKALQDIRETLDESKGPGDAGEFLVQLLGRLFERMEPVLAELDEETDDIEEQVMEEPTVEERGQIIDIRKRAILLRRYISPQRDVLMQLRGCELPWLTVMHRRRLQESLDRVTRYVEDLDAIRERSQVVKDELANALSDRLNRNLYLLSIVAAIFLPLGFLTGLLGVNVAGIPGAEAPYAFWVFSGLLALVVALQVWLFKKLKWF